MSDNQDVKIKNENHELKMLLTCMIRDKIDNDEDGQVDLPLDYLGSYWKDHMYPIIDDIIKEITTHERCNCDKGGSCFSSYHNGYYYRDDDCYDAYELHHSCGCISITSKIDTSESDDDDEKPTKYEVRTEEGVCKYLGENLIEAKKHYKGLVSEGIKVFNDGIIIYYDNNFDDYNVYSPELTEDDSDDEQYQQLCNDCSDKLCKNTHIYCLEHKNTGEELTICSSCFDERVSTIEDFDKYWYHE